MAFLQLFFLVQAVVFLVDGQNTNCLVENNIEDHLADATNDLESFMRSFLGDRGADHAGNLSLYNHTRNALGLNYSVRNEVAFTSAVREIALAETAVSSGAVTIDIVQSILTLEELFTQAEAGNTYDAVELRTHFGYLVSYELQDNTPKYVRDFFASLTLARFGTCLNLIEQFYTVAFVVDDTGSMSDEIHHVQELITEFVQSGTASPSHYILASFNDPEVGIPHKYNATSPDELNQLLTDVNALTPHGGADCPELAMTGMLNALNLSSFQGHIIVLTDAGPKDINLTSDVIQRAQELQATIHFTLSTPLCSNGSQFFDIAHATGGIIVEDLTSLTALSRHLNRFFRSDFEAVVANASVTPSDDGSNMTCKNVSVSQFVRSLSLGVAPTPGRTADIEIFQFPDLIVVDTTISALTFYTFEDPSAGQWVVCSSDPGFSIIMTDITDFDLTVQFVEYNLDTDSIYLSPYSPRNTTNGIVYAYSSRVGDLSSERMPYFDMVDPSGFVANQIPLQQCEMGSSQSLQGEFTIPDFPFELAFTAFDTKGLAVKVSNPIQYEPVNAAIICTLPCENGGICVLSGRCRCPTGWGGQQCKDFACDCGIGQLCSGPGVCAVQPAPLEAILPPIAALCILIVVMIVLTGVVYHRYTRNTRRSKRQGQRNFFHTYSPQGVGSDELKHTDATAKHSFPNRAFIEEESEVYY